MWTVANKKDHWICGGGGVGAMGEGRSKGEGGVGGRWEKRFQRD